MEARVARDVGQQPRTMIKSRWIIWHGVGVLYLDYAGFKQDIEALREEVRQADEEIQREPKGSVLVLIDLRDTVATGAVVTLFKESSALTNPYIRKHALIGVTGMKRFLADKVAKLARRPMRLFDTEQQALDWLTKGEAGETVGEIIGVEASS
jgi:hypothetical protein